MRKPSMQEKFESVQRDMAEGRYNTIEQACNANKISPASYHIYRKRQEALETGSKPEARTTYQAPTAKRVSPSTTSTPPSSSSSNDFLVKMLQEKVEYLESQNAKLMDTLVNLINKK